MLNWICPECGRENDPTFAECPCLAEPFTPVPFSGVTRFVHPEAVASSLRSVPPEPPPACRGVGLMDAACEMPELATPVCALTVLEPEPRLAAKVALVTGPVDMSVHGPALMAMLAAIRNEPRLLAPALEIEILAGTSLRERVPVPDLDRWRCGEFSIWHTSRFASWPDSPAIAALPVVSEDRTPRRRTSLQFVAYPDPASSAPAPRQPNAVARPRRRMLFPSFDAKTGALGKGSQRPLEPAPARAWSGACRGLFGPLRRRSAAIALPTPLRRFQEAVVPRVAWAPRPAPAEPVARQRGGIPSWLISVATAAAVLIAALFAVQHFGQRVEARGVAATPPPAATTEPAAYGAWPSIDKFVEVTALRLTTDQQQNSEAVFTVVNHSSTEVGAMAVHVTVPAAKAGDPPLCDITAPVSALAPWESREVRAPLATQLHASDLPDWKDLHPKVQITLAP